MPNSERLFVYGTLIDPQVQQSVFGRVTGGSPDELAGFAMSSWEAYPMIVRDPHQSVNGYILDVTPTELAAIDAYETDAYDRIRVTLVSGAEAWVYAAPGSGN